jgi:hypothetical protein
VATKADVIFRLTQILTSKATQQIDFELDKVRLQGSALSAIVGYVMFKQIGFAGADVDFGNVAAGAGASYDPATNTYHFKDMTFGQTASDGEDAVHESVHAWLDLRMPKVRTTMDAVKRLTLTTTAVTDEAVAYVAGALYYLYRTTPAGGNPKKPWWATAGSDFGAGYDIALKIMNKPGAVVASADVKALKTAILASPTYAALKANPAMTYGNDGL